MSKLMQLRTARRLSLADLAKMLDPPTTPQQVHNLETGERKLTEKWVNRLAAALGVAPYDIYEDSEMIVTAQEREVVDRLRTLAVHHQEAIVATIRHLSRAEVSLQSDKGQEP